MREVSEILRKPVTHASKLEVDGEEKAEAHESEDQEVDEPARGLRKVQVAQNPKRVPKMSPTETPARKGMKAEGGQRTGHERKLEREIKEEAPSRKAPQHHIH